MMNYADQIAASTMIKITARSTTPWHKKAARESAWWYVSKQIAKFNAENVEVPPGVEEADRHLWRCAFDAEAYARELEEGGEK